MPLAGRKPKEDGQKVNRHKPTHDWLEVPNEPYRGKRPDLPKGISPATRAWWNRVTRLPHCVLWNDGDWQFAIDTARLHTAFVFGDFARASELRIRENQMGTTLDSLRDLRIRYVDAAEPEEADISTTEVTNFEAERRKRLIDAG